MLSRLRGGGEARCNYHWAGFPPSPPPCLSRCLCFLSQHDKMPCRETCQSLLPQWHAHKQTHAHKYGRKGHAHVHMWAETLPKKERSVKTSWDQSLQVKGKLKYHQMPKYERAYQTTDIQSSTFLLIQHESSPKVLCKNMRVHTFKAVPDFEPEWVMELTALPNDSSWSWSLRKKLK